MPRENKETFYLQEKYGIHAGWRDTGKYYNLNKAILKCEDLKAKNRRVWAGKYYKSRVVTREGDAENRIYPPQKPNPREK